MSETAALQEPETRCVSSMNNTQNPQDSTLTDISSMLSNANGVSELYAKHSDDSSKNNKAQESALNSFLIRDSAGKQKPAASSSAVSLPQMDETQYEDMDTSSNDQLITPLTSMIVLNAVGGPLYTATWSSDMTVPALASGDNASEDLLRGLTEETVPDLDPTAQKIG
jgi:hypothetical protein